MPPNRVSIHAPAKGATMSGAIFDLLPLFQSTRPRRARLEVEASEGAVAIVSIHAPAKGATEAAGRLGA